MMTNKNVLRRDHFLCCVFETDRGLDIGSAILFWDKILADTELLPSMFTKATEVN
jgi:hypothetical protein